MNRKLETLVLVLFGVMTAHLRADTTLAKVPNCQGQPIVVAKQLARLAGLTTVTGVYYLAPKDWRETLKPDVVYFQSLPPKSATPTGSPLGLWTFKKAKKDRLFVTMPNLKGKTIQTVKKLLVENRLELMIPDKTEESVQQFKIVDQYPPAGRSIYTGTSVFVRLKK